MASSFKANRSQWLKPLLTLSVLALLAWFSPKTAVDPWNLLSPKKMATMIFALALIQAFGSVMAQLLGAKTGAILTGFFGGLVSSTATTASLARKSKTLNNADVSVEILTFLSATCAMLFEAAALALTGAGEIHSSILIIFFGPIILTIIMIIFQSRKLSNREHESQGVSFEILPIIKISIFILLILLLSKVLQNQFGKNGLMVLTFLVSLFEIHGSIIANVQMHDRGVITVSVLGSLLSISIIASFLSKLFLITTLGSKELKAKALKSIFILFGTVFLSWLSLFIFL